MKLQGCNDLQLGGALHRFGSAIESKAARRHRRHLKLSVSPYEGYRPETIEAAQQRAKAITAERDLPEPPPSVSEPYKSLEDQLTERLEQVLLVDTSHAEQLPLFPV